MDKFKSANTFYHKTLKNTDGTPQKYERNGKTKLWKTKPTEFSIPVKRGLREYGYITQDNMNKFTV